MTRSLSWTSRCPSAPPSHLLQGSPLLPETTCCFLHSPHPARSLEPLILLTGGQGWFRHLAPGQVQGSHHWKTSQLWRRGWGAGMGCDLPRITATTGVGQLSVGFYGTLEITQFGGSLRGSRPGFPFFGSVCSVPPLQALSPAVCGLQGSHTYPRSMFRSM